MAAVANVGSSVEDRVVEETKPVDRKKTCPLLLRVFISRNRHSALSEFSRGNVPANELQIYTWMDCTLQELMQLVKEVNPESRRRGTTYEFSIVFPDPRATSYRMRKIGTTTNGLRGGDDNKSLQQCKLEIGDYIDVAIMLPGRTQARRGGRNY